MGVTSKPRSKFAISQGGWPRVYSTSPRHFKTYLNSLTLIGAHKVDSECLGQGGYRWFIRRFTDSWGDSCLKILDGPMRNLLGLAFVPPLVPLQYCLVPTLPQWYVSFRLSSLYLLADLFKVLIDCVVVDSLSPNQSKISVPP